MEFCHIHHRRAASPRCPHEAFSRELCGCMCSEILLLLLFLSNREAVCATTCQLIPDRSKIQPQVVSESRLGVSPRVSAWLRPCWPRVGICQQLLLTYCVCPTARAHSSHPLGCSWPCQSSRGCAGTAVPSAAGSASFLRPHPSSLSKGIVLTGFGITQISSTSLPEKSTPECSLQSTPYRRSCLCFSFPLLSIPSPGCSHWHCPTERSPVTTSRTNLELSVSCPQCLAVLSFLLTPRHQLASLGLPNRSLSCLFAITVTTLCWL